MSFDFPHVVNVVFVENVQELRCCRAVKRHRSLSHVVSSAVVHFAQQFSIQVKSRKTSVIVDNLSFVRISFILKSNASKFFRIER